MNMEDFLTGELQPVRKAPPPPKTAKPLNSVKGNTKPAPRVSIMKYKQSINSSEMKHSTSLPFVGSQMKKAPPPRPPPPKVCPNQRPNAKGQRNKNLKDTRLSKFYAPQGGNITKNKGCNSTIEASLIDFSSPPHSPTTGSGSDGMSINSFGSESSGTHSGGFDDNFDPFGSIQEESLGCNVTKTVGASSFYDNTSLPNSKLASSRNTSNITSNSDAQNNFNNDVDPFEMLALRSQTTVTKEQKFPFPAAIPENHTRPNKGNLSSQNSNSSKESNNQPLKTSYRATIIRPKGPTSNRSESCALTQSSSMPSILDEEVINALSNNLKCNSTLTDDGPPLPPRPAKEEDDVEGPHAIAEFDYETSEPDDLVFKVDDVIQLLYAPSDDWLFGRCGLREGMFPRNFVRIIVPLLGEESIEYSTSNDDNIESSVVEFSTLDTWSKSSSSIDVPSNNYVTALYTFQAETNEDLTIYEGSQVKVLGQLSDEWLYGELDGKKGQFPKTFIDQVPVNLPIISL